MYTICESFIKIEESVNEKKYSIISNYQSLLKITQRSLEENSDIFKNFYILL